MFARLTLKPGPPGSGWSTHWLASRGAGGWGSECLLLACTSDLETGIPRRDSSRDGLPLHSHSGVDHVDPVNSYGVVRLVRGADARGSS